MAPAVRWVIGGVAALVLAYAASPYWAGWQLRQAMRARDTASLQARVDWPTLRANLKPKVVAAVEASAKDSNGVSGMLKRVIGGAVAEKGVDLMVTPANLARVLAGREFVTSRMARSGSSAPPPAPAPPKQGSSSDPADVEDPDDPVPPRRVRWAFFETPTRFRVEAVHPRLPGQRIVTHLDFQNFGWKLVDISMVEGR